MNKNISPRTMMQPLNKLMFKFSMRLCTIVRNLTIR
jgi:hypothetical protein